MAEGELEAEKLDTHQLLFQILQGVCRLSHDLRLSGGSDSSPMKAVFELRTASDVILSLNPLLLSFASRIRHLADSVEEVLSSKPQIRGLASFVGLRLKSLEVSRLVSEIESEMVGLIDRQLLLSLREIVVRMRSSKRLTYVNVEEEDKLFEKMSLLQERLSRGFDIDFQDLLLKSEISSELEWVLRNQILSQRVREKAAVSIKELVLFNKDVFVGSIVNGGSSKALVSMGSCCSLLVLSSLIKAIRSPLVDQMDSSGLILDIVSYLSSGELERVGMALFCIMQIGYFGRKAAIDSLINCELIRRLVELQRIEQASNSCRSKNNNKTVKQTMKPFCSCVARFVMQLEVGEGLRRKEKRAFRLRILNQIKDACESAETVYILAEVLWYS